MPSEGKGERLEASKMMTLRLALPYIVLMFICANNVANVAGAHDWCYKNPLCDARTWAGECQTGKQQSPIDFNAKNTKNWSGGSESIRLRFNSKYRDVYDKFYVKNNGHTIQVQLQQDLASDLLMDGDYLKGSYRFSQLHFHWGSHQDVGSEHTVNGNGYVAELHLVHYSNQYKSLTDAVGSKDRRGLAVLGIFLEISADKNYAVQPIIDAISKVPSATSQLQMVDNVHLNLTSLLPDELSLWRYYGSLTTPSCNEVVHWTVFKKPIKISRDQWQAFLTSKDTSSDPIQDNNRPTQLTINRKVYFFERVIYGRMPDADEDDRNPPADDTFFDKAQKDIKAAVDDTRKEEQPSGNGASSGPAAGIINSAITGFFILTLFLQILVTSVLRCR